MYGEKIHAKLYEHAALTESFYILVCFRAQMRTVQQILRVMRYLCNNDLLGMNGYYCVVRITMSAAETSSVHR